MKINVGQEKIDYVLVDDLVFEINGVTGLEVFLEEYCDKFYIKGDVTVSSKSLYEIYLIAKGMLTMAYIDRGLTYEIG